MNRVAIIPARGGSKRLPRKNIKNFLGRPLIAYSIEIALSSKCFDRVVVSTEDEEIAGIAREYGAEVHNRSASLSGDNNTVAEVCVDFLKSQKEIGINWDQMVVLYATSPLRNLDDIKGVINVLESGDCDLAMGVTEYSHYVHQALSYDSNNHAKPVFPDWVSKGHSEIPIMHVSNGSIYATWCDYFSVAKSFYPERLKTYLMPRERSFDIDDLTDFKVAEAIAKAMNEDLI